MSSLQNPHHRRRTEVEKRRFEDLASRKLNALEVHMQPDFRGKGNFRNQMSRRIWHKPHRYTQAGIPTFRSVLDRMLGIFPWQRDQRNDTTPV